MIEADRREAGFLGDARSHLIIINAIINKGVVQGRPRESATTFDKRGK